MTMADPSLKAIAKAITIFISVTLTTALGVACLSSRAMSQHAMVQHHHASRLHHVIEAVQ
jgi:hypothetical protein